jgi:hypothetical protein
MRQDAQARIVAHDDVSQWAVSPKWLWIEGIKVKTRRRRMQIKSEVQRFFFVCCCFKFPSVRLFIRLLGRTSRREIIANFFWHVLRNFTKCAFFIKPRVYSISLSWTSLLLEILCHYLTPLLRKSPKNHGSAALSVYHAMSHQRFMAQPRIALVPL